MKGKLISLPIVSGLPTLGSYGLPDLLVRAGMIRHLQTAGVQLANMVEVPVPKLTGGPGPDPKAFYLEQIAGIVSRGYDGLKNQLGSQEFPIFMGGDCGLSLATLREMARLHHGLNLVWLDAHGDFNTPDTTPSGFIGGMVLAAAVGRGPEELTSFADPVPPVSEDHVGLMALRDLDELEEVSLRESRVTWRLFEKDGELRSAVDEFLDGSEGPVFVHLDMDSVDPRDVPHVNFPTPGGPRVPEVRRSLLEVSESGRMVGFEVASLDARQANEASSAGLISRLVAEVVSVAME
ncbi:MAG: arginase family protein [Candidatus Geothermarchaeales archaeon]